MQRLGGGDKGSALITPPRRGLTFLQRAPPGPSSHRIELYGFGKGLRLPICKKQRGEHPAQATREPDEEQMGGQL